MRDFAKKLGKTIKIARIKQDLNQYELAAQADITQSHLSKVELGGVNISVIKLKCIADVLGCKMSDLLLDIE